jgi:hypothetical protein
MDIDDVIQALARRFENAKLGARCHQELATHFGLPWAGSLITNLLGGMALGSGTALGSVGALSSGAFALPLTSSFVLGMMAYRMKMNLPIAIQVYQQSVEDHRAICTRCESVAFLENSFPRLRGLGLGLEIWQDLANSTGKLSQLLIPAFRAIAFS